MKTVNKQANNSAFTLAEVLITIAIIGIVAAMTLPTIITKYQKKQTVTQLKKAYSELQQALRVLDAENEGLEYLYSDVDNLSTGNWAERNKDFLDKYLAQKIKFIKICTPITNECWSDKINIYVNDNYYRNRFVSGVTASGYSLFFWLGGFSSQNNRHIQIYIDTNGPKRGKNELGKDIFHSIFYFRNIAIDAVNNLQLSRDELIENCTNEANGCVQLIMMDGWQIKDDYPW